MKTLLLAMPDTVPQFSAKTWRAPNLALSSIAGNLDGHEVAIADLILKRKKVKETLTELVADYRPEMVGLSAMSFQFDTARKIAHFIKHLDPNVKTAIGGYHCTLMHEEIAQSAEESYPFDFIVRGEGDLSFGEMLDAIEGRRAMEDVNGISYRKNGSFCHNKPRGLEDLEKINIPNRDARIWHNYRFSAYPLDIVESSRGCTMKCNFCSMNRMYGRTFRTYKIDRMVADIADAKKHGAKFIAFADDNITLDIDRFANLCDAITEAGLNDIRYIVQASSMGIASSPELSQKMARAGFKVVFLGIENASPKNLKLMKKSNTVELTKRAVKNLHDNDIMIVGGMIIGHEEDDEDDIAYNFRFFDEMEIDFFGDQIITPYPKTAMREEMLEKDLVTNLDDFSKYNGYWANVRTRYLPTEELQFIRWKERRRYSTFFKTTKTFKKNYPLVNMIRVLFLRPYYRVKNLLLSLWKTERETYEAEMRRHIETNNFFENEHSQ